MDGTPHRVVGNIADGIADSAKGLLGAGVSAVKGAGKTIMGALDKPFKGVTGKEGPHRIIDRAADGAVDATSTFYNGSIGAAKAAGEGFMKALDQPPEQTGIPPDLGKFQIFRR